MFAAPAFLLGLLAIGLPLWLHRIARENRIRQQYSSLMLLEASEVQRTAHRKLRYFVLLALRILLLIAIALAFAEPLLSSRLAAPVAGNARLHAIVVDGSMSMRYEERWTRALAEARRTLGSLASGDRAMLVSAAGSRIQVIAPASASGDLSAARAALDTLTPQLGRLDYGQLMSTADSWLGTRTLPVTLHIVTDVQQSAAPLQFADLQPPVDTRLQLHDVGAAGGANAWIDEVDLAPQDSRAIQVRVAGLGERESREVVLTVDGKERARRRVEAPRQGAQRPGDSPGEGTRSAGPAATAAAPPVPAGGAAAAAPALATFADLELTDGAHRVTARLEPADALPTDDERHAVIRHGSARVLVAGPAASGDDIAYFAAAIGAVTRPRLTVERAEAQGLGARDLGAYSAVVVSDSGSLPAAAAARLRRHLEAGGTALVTLGPRALAAGTDPLTGLAIRDGGTSPLRVAAVEDSHPALREAQSWRGVRFFRHLKVAAAPGDRVLAALEDGSPLLLEREVGAGRLLVLAAPLAREWNDLAIHPLFVQFISEVARYLADADASAADATVGVPVATGLTAASGGQIFDPQGRRAATLGAAGTGRLVPDQVGFYEIRGGNQARWIAVNVDARESLLVPMSAAMLERWQTLRRVPATPGAAGQQASASGPDGAAAVEADSRLPLGRWFLAAAVLFALLEMFFANRLLGVRREVAQ